MGLVLVLGVLGAACFLLPWKSILEDRVTAMLQFKGYQNISFQIKDIGLRHATLEQIRAGREDPMVLESVEIQYSLRELLNGKMQSVVLTGIDFDIREQESGVWRMDGMDVLSGRKDARPFDLGEVIQSLPLTSLSVKDSHLRITGKAFQVSIPFSLTVTKTPVMSLNGLFGATDLMIGADRIAIGRSDFKAFPVNGGGGDWAGEWRVESIDPGKILPSPILRGKGDFSLKKSLVRLGGDFVSDDQAYNASLEIKADLHDPKSYETKLSSASFPFKEGHVSTQDVVLKMPLSAVIDVRNVSVDAMLQSLTGNRVKATGTVSGSVPVTVHPDGRYIFGKGALTADGGGQIQMEADAIPGEGDQIALVRDILANFQYSLLSTDIVSGEDGKIAVLLKLEGNNPDIYNGRVVKLNVNLTGDVVDFVQQNIMMLNTPERLLKQDMHE